MPIGPVFASSNISTIATLRYMYEGGILGQGRICHIHLDDNDQNKKITVSEIYETLQNDGVDLDTFYACAYEPNEGGWMPLESGPRHTNSVVQNGADDNEQDDAGQIVFPVPSKEDSKISKRIDIQLFRRPKIRPRESFDSIGFESKLSSLSTSDQTLSRIPTVEHSSDALRAISASVPVGKLSREEGYCGIGIFQPKVAPNIGTLWRSAYQLGASILYTIGGRQKASNAADTLDVPTRIPLIQLENWNAFAEWASPKGAVWVAVEMGGTPLADFEHPRNAIYILGSEDNGVPKSVVRACRDVVSLDSERYGSYNVAVAGSIVLYDRMMKMKEESNNNEKSDI
mmetsp:Transcript_6872/g.10439  ORF Transcript_6872/g.10439 Transcript_6872/m.10439 type:complete len:343 (+) Transcript_6872:2358-3386(+)